MVSIPPDLLELLDLIKSQQMYPTRSAVLHEGIRRMAKSLGQDEEKKSVAGEGVEEKKSEMEES